MKLIQITSIVFLAAIVIVGNIFINSKAGDIAGKWRIVSVWGRDVNKMKRFDVVKNKRISIKENGYFKIGRRGLDGIISMPMIFTQNFHLTQNSNGDEFKLLLGGENKEILTIIGKRRNEVIVARRIKQKK